MTSLHGFSSLVSSRSFNLHFWVESVTRHIFMFNTSCFSHLYQERERERDRVQKKGFLALGKLGQRQRFISMVLSDD